jgi:hypothetical protein
MSLVLRGKPVEAFPWRLSDATARLAVDSRFVHILEHLQPPAKRGHDLTSVFSRECWYRTLSRVPNYRKPLFETGAL